MMLNWEQPQVTKYGTDCPKMLRGPKGDKKENFYIKKGNKSQNQ